MAKRLIDAEALDKVIEFYQAGYSPVESRGNAFMYKALSAVRKMVTDAPTVDAVVPVVRCKECVWFEPKHIEHNDGTIEYVAEESEPVTLNIGINCQARCRRLSYIDNLFVHDDGNDFCSYGKAKEGDDGLK